MRTGSKNVAVLFAVVLAIIVTVSTRQFISARSRAAAAHRQEAARQLVEHEENKLAELQSRLSERKDDIFNRRFRQSLPAELRPHFVPHENKKLASAALDAKSATMKHEDQGGFLEKEAATGDQIVDAMRKFIKEINDPATELHLSFSKEVDATPEYSAVTAQQQRVFDARQEHDDADRAAH